MDEQMREEIKRMKLIKESLTRRASIYSNLAKIDDKGTARSLGALQRASAPGKKMQKIGFIMFWVPEMILAGRYLDKVYNGSTISDIGHETKNTFSAINDFKKAIS